MKKSIGILGLGEVGQAIKQLCRGKFTVYSRDLDHDQLKGRTVDVLHICLPYSGRFLTTVIKTIKQVKPKLVIVNSTVKVGTTRKIFRATGTAIADSPIKGVHPHLARYQMIFPKVLGPINEPSFKLAKEHWQTLGAKKIIRFDRPEESELAKLLSTTYYFTEIVFNKVAKRYCEKTGTNFDQVYTQFNQVYNAGYDQIRPEYHRAILKYIPGKIGGHCVIPNAKILRTVAREPLLEFLLKFNETL